MNGLIHAGNSFFCNSADGTGQDANVETGTKIDGSGYAELVAMRDIQVGEELLDSYPIWDYDGSGEFLSAVGDGVDAVELLGFDISSDEAQEILDLRYHMANLKAKVARLEELRDNNEGQIAGLKRQVHSISSDNSQLKTKVARLTEAHQKEIDHLKLAHERAMADLKRRHEKEVADLERQAAAGSSNSRLWWGCVNQISYVGGYRDTSTTESESEDDEIPYGGIVHCETDYQANTHDAVNVDIGTLSLDNGASETVADDESNGIDSSQTADNQSLELKETEGNDSIRGIGIVEDAAEVIDQDDGDDDCPPPPPLPGQVIEAGHSSIASPRSDDRWNERLGDLREYKDQNGHCNVPHRQGPLGKWVNKQRYLYRKRKGGEQTPLTDERVAALEAIGFAWDGTGNEERWNERLAELRDYKEENGDCNVPGSQGPLGRWVSKQRKLYRMREKGEQTPLTDERVAALDVLGFEWDGTVVNKPGRIDDDRWYERLGELQVYRHKNGHCNVPQNQGPLGSWVINQRCHYRKRGKGEQTPLTDERVAALEAIGFAWDGTGNEERWNERLGGLREYKKEKGHCNVPHNQGPLGRWVNLQRNLYRKRKYGERTPLTDERIAALEAIGFEWVWKSV